mmetsp:Transcript_14774/g.21103  ORF Transcript_14774/g.21103 Transcript_14774/m.21103 type:complete len:92 (-) Transcript_14774:741-1016(-)
MHKLNDFYFDKFLEYEVPADVSSNETIDNRSFWIVIDRKNDLKLNPSTQFKHHPHPHRVNNSINSLFCCSIFDIQDLKSKDTDNISFQKNK